MPILRDASRAVLTGALRQVARLPLTRRAIHKVSTASRGPAIAFLRCRRILPDTAEGRAHPDVTGGSALTPSQLERNLKDIQRTVRFVHPGEAVSSLAEGARLRQASCVLTFDESFAATAELALPVLRRLQVPALFFVTTQHLDGNTPLWDQEIHAHIADVAPAPISVPWIDEVLRTDTVAHRAHAARRLLLALVALDEQRLAERIADLFAKSPAPPAPHSLDRMLNATEVARISRDPLISIGAHGHRHLAMTSLSDDALLEELTVPRRILRELCAGAYADVVSYPFGSSTYFDRRVTAAAREVGYRAGFTAVPGVARPSDHLFELPRLAIDPRNSLVDAYELAGVSDAVDELLLVATGTQDRRVMALEG